MFKKKKGDDARKKRKWEQEADEDYDVNAPLPEKREASPEPEWSEGLYDEEVSACRYRGIGHRAQLDTMRRWLDEISKRNNANEMRWQVPLLIEMQPRPQLRIQG
jgi:hypothetical protein